MFFEDESVELEDSEHWFEVDVLGVEDTEVGENEGNQETTFKTDNKLIEMIKAANLDDPLMVELIDTTLNPISSMIKEAISKYKVKDGLLFNDGRIQVPDNNEIKYHIVKSRHDSLLAGHPGRAKTLNLVKRSFTWPSMKAYVNSWSLDGYQLRLDHQTTGV